MEEEASIDFVFIPPETKERVLTEHQKEVKRTKRLDRLSTTLYFLAHDEQSYRINLFFPQFCRVDIPAMYNNLDASLDTTVFTQYTQSQEET